ncbi:MULTISPECIES: Crp/Fnr family transcriptional regulator [Anaerofustis]|uniref:Crp/Fnr family transcriptional regulator n=1 Tax=Anaerofustis TaxID=264995 RepID=UPI001105E991|nr:MULTISPECIES: Crp/Fnr family transcriptional regulator [Anaerofustis]MCO8194153.1 Crp/Fnr family transcriptional regulator [Anaerofustis sp. NSJ-163]
MKKINDLKQIEKILKKTNIKKYFSTENLKFVIYKYDKGEQITSPDKKLDDILFITDGIIRIYGLRDNGTISPVNQQKAPIIIGDIEFTNQGNPPFFTDAATDVTCLALSIKKYKKELENDIPFLHLLLRSYSEKLQFFAFVEAAAETVEQRVLLYLKNISPSNKLEGIDASALKLRCSRRQLQRVLTKLCQSGQIEKTGKGKYKLK